MCRHIVCKQVLCVFFLPALDQFVGICLPFDMKVLLIDVKMSKTNKTTGIKVFQLFALFKALEPITGGYAGRQADTQADRQTDQWPDR